MCQERQSVAPHPIPEGAFRKELPLRDLLHDPVIGKLMASDGVSRSDLLDLMSSVRDRLSAKKRNLRSSEAQAA